MAKPKKTLSEIDKKLAVIASEFDIAYGDWSRNPSAPSSATPDNSGISKGRRPKANRVETKPDRPDQPIRGFINETLFLKNFLLKQKESEEFKTLAIVGKFGVGKTTLCQDVFNNGDVKQAYHPRIWVSMYSEETKEDQDPKIAVVKRILRSLGVEDEMFEYIKTEAKEEKQNKVEEGKTEEETVEEKELSRLLRALNANLIGKKYLIVLDDVWEDNEWNQRLDEDKIQQEKSHLSCGFPKGCGGRVIVTSRDEKLAKKIVGEEENLQRLFPRSDPESVLEIYNDAFGEHVKDAVEKLMKDAAGFLMYRAGLLMYRALTKHKEDAVEELVIEAEESMKEAGEPMKVAVEKLRIVPGEEPMKDAAEKLVKDAVEKFMKDAGRKLMKDAAEELMKYKFMKDAGGKLMKDAAEELMKYELMKDELMKDAAKELMKDAAKKFIKDGVENLMKDAGGKLPRDAGGTLSNDIRDSMKGEGVKLLRDEYRKHIHDTLEDFIKDEGLNPKLMKDAAEKLMKDAVEKFMKDVAEKLLKDAGGKLIEDADGKQKKLVVNPRYPRRYKQELMDKSCGIPWVAQKLAKIEPLKMDEDKDK